MSSRNRKQELKVILLNLIQLYKENRKHPSKHVIIFLVSLLSSTAVGAIYLLNKIISDIRDKRDSRPLYKRSSSTLLKNGARELFIPYKSRQKRVIIKPTDPELYEKDKFKYKNFMKNIRDYEKDGDHIFSSKFLNQLIIIWQILIPKVNDNNAVLLVTQFFFLILRTWLSLLIAKLDGQIVKDIIGGNLENFCVIWYTGF